MGIRYSANLNDVKRYTFLSMGGENQVFDDMDTILTSELC